MNLNIRKKVTWACPPGLGRFAALDHWVRAAEAQGWSAVEVQQVLDEVVEADNDAAGHEVLAYYSARA